ncbi:MAG: hypothetical protein R2857_00675 [Vampirovibrionales bacterium]
MQPPAQAVDHGGLTDSAAPHRPTAPNPASRSATSPSVATPLLPPQPNPKPAVPKLPDWLDAALKAFSPLPMAVQGRLKPLAFAVHGTDTRVGGNALYELIAQLVGQRHPMN